MFIEQIQKSHPRKGWIEVVTGSMFSGKTEELIRRLKRAKIAKQQVEIFKPAIERRYDEQNIICRVRIRSINYIICSIVFDGIYYMYYKLNTQHERISTLLNKHTCGTTRHVR